MRILFVVPYPPLLTKPRPHHFLRRLAARGHEIHLLAQTTAAEEASAVGPGWDAVVDASASVTWDVVPRSRSIARALTSLPTRTPLRVAYVRSRRLASLAAELIERHGIDLIHVDRERLGPILRDIPRPKVLDATDSLTLYLRQARRFARGPEKLVAALELAKMPGYERRMALGYGACLVTTEADARALAGGAAPVEVVPNGVDEALFEVEREPDGRSILFVGTMSYPPNVDAALWLAHEILPRVRERHADARLVLVGHRPAPAVERLAGREGIEVTGAVPDVVPYLRSAAVFAAPMRIGGGFPNKVAEALATGVPVVATRQGFEGITGVRPDEHLLEAGEPREFADAVVRLLGEPGLGDRLAAAAKEHLRAEHTWSAVVDRLEAVYARVARG